MTVTREQLLPLLQQRFHSVVCYPTGEEQENLLIEVVGPQDQGGRTGRIKLKRPDASRCPPPSGATIHQRRLLSVWGAVGS